jgi:hypothetical protein
MTDAFRRTFTLVVASSLSCLVALGQSIEGMGWQPGSAETSQQRRLRELQEQQRRQNQAQSALAYQQAAQRAAVRKAEWNSFFDAASSQLRAERDKTIAGKVNSNTVWVTNLVDAGPDYRVVNGEAFDITSSKAWGDFAAQEKLGYVGKDLHGYLLRRYMSVRKIFGTTVFCDIYTAQEYPEKYSGIPEELSNDYEKTVVILNYPTPALLTTGGGVKCRCMKTTNYLSSSGSSYAAYDCGIETKKTVVTVDPQDPSYTDIQIINQEYEAKLKDLPNVYAKQLQDNENAKKQAVHDRVLKSNQDLADKGDSYGLLRMGQRYRDGDGVPKDLIKARECLAKAAAAGSLTAEEELKTLPAH